MRHIGRAIATAALWGITAFMLLQQIIVVVSVYELILAFLILLHATVATVAIWWIPRMLQDGRFGMSGASEKDIRMQFPARPLTVPGLGLWWNLAFVAAIMCFAALPVWLLMHFGYRFWGSSFPIPMIPPVLVVLALPVFYLTVFALWHWRTRYAGRQHIAWLILFGLSALPSSIALPRVVFVALAYSFMNLLPDALGIGAYAMAPTVTVRPPASPLPKRFALAKSACFVIGWVLVVGGVLTAATTCITAIIVWNKMQEAIPYEVGKVLTESKGSTLWVSSQIAKASSVTSLMSVIAAAVGAALIQVSQRLRWRLLEEQDRQKLLECIQQTPAAYPEGRADAPSGSADS